MRTFRERSGAARALCCIDERRRGGALCRRHSPPPLLLHFSISLPCRRRLLRLFSATSAFSRRPSPMFAAMPAITLFPPSLRLTIMMMESAACFISRHYADYVISLCYGALQARGVYEWRRARCAGSSFSILPFFTIYFLLLLSRFSHYAQSAAAFMPMI